MKWKNIVIFFGVRSNFSVQCTRVWSVCCWQKSVRPSCIVVDMGTMSYNIMCCAPKYGILKYAILKYAIA